MKGNRKRRNCFTVLFAIGVFLTIWFAVNLAIEMAFVHSTASITLLIFLIKQNRLFNDASLIWDNLIFAVPSSVISISESKEKRDAEETIVSTFGILIGRKIYKWGSEGVYGVRLGQLRLTENGFI